ncbi:MAG: FAD binding domain-containing protein, partial [Thermoplasmata archaeon]|nr:FAD binding domain-containing protein [Thermoplasmata archaeon]
DLAPALGVVEAELEVAGPDGRRRFPVLDMYDPNGDGIKRHRLGPGELAVAVHLPANRRGHRATYRKLRVRPSFDFPELGVAAAASFDGDTVATLALALGGLETYPRRFDALTEPLVGQRLTTERIESIAQEIRRQVRPVHNTFLAPDYRKKMAGVFVRRALEDLLRPTGSAS